MPLGCELKLPTNSLNCRRNLVNILLYVAEQCKRYYPATEIPAMLETFLPMLTKEVRLYSNRV